jgi:hypothetical protein
VATVVLAGLLGRELARWADDGSRTTELTPVPTSDDDRWPTGAV